MSAAQVSGPHRILVILGEDRQVALFYRGMGLTPAFAL